ncbi:polyglutamine-binding protein 1 [Phlebotomus argentipes]|uniref:polyglutamine-binding protein 1 n=1 Tax=Phlebotomus argentipes TaxID=94469 RepID=UPI0028929E20|nr:polyglutamine-binding protein 1 [Phlebotomus argentipes]
MPLPPALLARLAKRGIIEGGKDAESIQNEEIIAEDYDDIEEPAQYDFEPVKKPPENFWSESLKRRITEGNSLGYKNCPNKYNIFHKCTLFCINRWTERVGHQSEEYKRRKEKLLKRYPLPKHWMEIFDEGCGVHYYWNTQDDTVTWLPPTHPKAHVSKSAAVLRKELDEVSPEEDQDSGLLPDTEMIPLPQSESDYVKSQMPPPKKPKARDLEKTLKAKSERRSRGYKPPKDLDVLDPMDPASYSDIPRGTWASGLDHEDKKSGVDTTASGSLYQMRPYPSPGAILKKKAQESEQNNSDDSDGEK